MEIENMTIEEVEKRMGELADIARDPEKRSNLTIDDMDAMVAEKEKLESRKAELDVEYRSNLDEVNKRNKMLENIASGKTELPLLRKFEELKMDEMYTVKSPEYRSAFFKKMAGESLNEVEQRAFTQTTVNFSGALPTVTLDQIWSNIEEEHSILGDISLFRSGTVLEASVHASIVAGDAASTAEGVANVDEENNWVKVSLSGKDFSKHIEVSYALGTMSAPALEEYLVREISDRLGAALAADVIAQITADTLAGNKKTSAGVKVTTYAELNSIFALVKAKGLAVYANQSTIYNYLTAIVDTTGRPVFQPSAQAGIQGFLIGAPVKVEDACADHVFYIGSPKKVMGNMVQDILIEKDRDVKRHVDIYAGYARFQCKLTKSSAFATLTIKQV